MKASSPIQAGTTSTPSKETWRRVILLIALAQIIAACTAGAKPTNSDVSLTVLSLNLHGYQELRDEHAIESELTTSLAQQRIDAYEPIFDRISAGIDELDPDIICFQEVGEWSANSNGDSESVEFGSTDTNMVKQILSRLGDQHYYSFMDWSHYGWEVWLEGSAVLSKYPLTFTESRFISNPSNGRHGFWKSRNVPMGKIDVPGIGSIAVFSVHAGWWDDPEEPFQEQYERLLSWTTESTEPASPTILCGDFNVPAGGPGYAFMLDDTGYTDQYARANPDGMFDATINGGVDGWEENGAGQRVDFILMNDDSPLVVMRARRVFTEENFGRVSDHVGLFAEFETKSE